MASEPKKDTASETALQAVEDALNIDFTEDEKQAARPAPSAGVSDNDPDFLELEQRLADAANDLRRQSGEPERAPAQPRPQPRAMRRNAERQPERLNERQPERQRASRADKSEFLPANDDRTGRSNVSFALGQAPSTRIFWVAALLSLVWIGLAGAFYVYARDGGLLDSMFGTSQASSGPVMWFLGAIVVIPLLLIWSFALMIRRAQEMRVAAQNMTEAAVRLLRPEDTAAASVATVGRAIRREVAAINEGMERAIARASELERFVQSEVGNLERSYTDAEVRLKGLVGELAEERHEIISHVDLLRDSLADTHTGITNEVDAVASRIEAAVLATTSRIVDSIDTEGLAVTGKLENVTGRLSDMLSQSGSQIAEAVALRASDFDRMVQDRVADLDSTVESRLTGFGSMLDGRIENLFDKLGSQQKGVEAVTERIEQLVDEQIGKAGKEFGNRGMTLIKALGNQAKALDKAMEDRTDKIGTIIGDRLSDFGQGVTTHMDSVIDQLEDRSGKLETTATRIEQAIAHNVTRLDENLRERALEVARSFTTGSDIITGVLDQAMEGVSSKALETKLGIESVQTEMTAAIDERIGAITSALERAVDDVSNKSVETRLSIESVQHAMTAAIDERFGAVTGALERAVESVSNKSLETRLGIESIQSEMTSAMDERIGIITSTLNTGHRRMVEELDKMDNRSTGLAAEIDKRTDRMGDLIAKAGTTLAHVIDERSDAIQRSIAQGHQRLVDELDKMDNRSTGLVAEIDKRSENMGEMVVRAGTHLANIIDQRTDTIQRSIAEGHSRLVEELDKMDNRSTGLVSEIDKRARALGDAVATSGTSLLSQFDERTAALRQSMDWGQKQLFEQVEVIDQRNSNLVSEMEKQVDRVGTSIRQASNDLSATFDSGVSLLRQNIGEGQQAIFGEIEHLGTAGAKLVDDISARTELLGEAMGNAVNHIGGVIDEKNKSIFTTLRQGRDEFLAEVEKSSRELLVNLDGKQAQFAEHLSEQFEVTGRQIDSKAEVLANLLTERAHAINTTLGSELLETQRSLETRTREFSSALAERAREINTILDEHGMPVVEGLRAGSSELISEIERVGGGLTSEIGQLLERMTVATGNLDTMSNQAGTSIATLERNITEGATQLSQSIERASMDSENARQVAERTATTVGETTEYLLNSLSGSSLRFEKQVKQLRDASDAVTESQKQLATVLEERQEPLEHLAADIADRSTQIEQSVLNFSGVLSGLIQEIMEKANTAGSKVTAEIEESFDQALARLAETVEAMRGASEDIRTELETTRTQMRRGVMELPVEVKESADSMRRVLVDQISALKELSEIVTKSGKAYDAAPPVVQQQPRLAAAGGGGSMAAAPTMRTAATSAPVHLEAVRAPAPDMQEPAPRRAAPRDTRSGPRPVAESRAESRSQSRTESREAPAYHEEDVEEAPSQQQQGRWVGDLLRRGGSRDTGADDHRPPPAANRQEPPARANAPVDADEESTLQAEDAVESLNSLSTDIARAIDHDSVVDVWERYQRGERNVFTRRLYTPQGQKTFDEIRAKYSREAEFRTAVDRYIADFERLLKDVGRNDRDNVMTQTYLTSDTGKVYTMLAHAAGRLGRG